MNISPETYQKRRNALAKKVKADSIVLTANHLLQKTTSETYPFFQDSNFFYFTGIDEPGWVLVIDTIKNREWLVKPKGSQYLSKFEGEVADEDIMQISNVHDIREYRDGWHTISELARNRTSLATIVPPFKYSDVYGMFLNPSRRALIDKIRRYSAKLNIVDIGGICGELRSVKDEVELALLQKAIDITGDALAKVRVSLPTITNECEIDAILSHHYISEQSNHAFQPIVASGANATILHYNKNKDPLVKDALIVIDTGAEHHKYNADITRTLAFGNPSKRHMDIFNAVQSVQAQAYDLLKPGVSLRDYEAQVEQIMGKALKELGLIDTMLRKNIRYYYPTATSHHLGLDTHDSANYDLPLAEGAVITVEPGIYIPEEGIGVRIEDDVVIARDGIDILTKEVAL